MTYNIAIIKDGKVQDVLGAWATIENAKKMAIKVQLDYDEWLLIYDNRATEIKWDSEIIVRNSDNNY